METIKPYVVKNRIVFAPGTHNRLGYRPEVVKLIHEQTGNKPKPLFYDHKNKSSANLIGFVTNRTLQSDGNVYGDLEILRPEVASIIQYLMENHPEQDIGISPQISGTRDRSTNEMLEGVMDDFSFVIDPAVKATVINSSVDTTIEPNAGVYQMITKTQPQPIVEPARVEQLQTKEQDKTKEETQMADEVKQPSMEDLIVKLQSAIQAKIDERFNAVDVKLSTLENKVVEIDTASNKAVDAEKLVATLQAEVAALKATPAPAPVIEQLKVEPTKEADASATADTISKEPVQRQSYKMTVGTKVEQNIDEGMLLYLKERFADID